MEKVQQVNSVLSTELIGMNWPLLRVLKLIFQALALCHSSDDGIMLKTLALKLFMVANLHYQVG